jgi:hypothetical protein
MRFIQTICLFDDKRSRFYPNLYLDFFLEQDDDEQKTVGGGELAKYLDRNYWEGQTQKDLHGTTLNRVFSRNSISRLTLCFLLRIH